MNEDNVSEKGTDNSHPTVVSKDMAIAPVKSSDNIFSSLNLFDEKQLAAAENFLTKVMRSEKGGIKSINDGLAILMRAQDLKIPFSSAIEHVHCIQGKTGVDIHIIKALLLKAAVTWECINDYTALYEYTDGINVYVDNELPSYCVKCISSKEAAEKNKEAAEKGEDIIYVYPVRYFQDFNKNVYKDYQLNSTYSVVANRTQAAEVSKAGKTPIFRIANRPIDYITEYEFSRIINGKVIKARSKFTYKEAITAGLFEKDTYTKYARILIGHRAFTYGARDIASDVIFGCYETTELKIMTGTAIDEQDVIDIDAIKVEK